VILRRATAVCAGAALALLAPAAASAKQTPGFSFTSHGTAVQPSATGDPNNPTSHDDFPFTIAPDDADGDLSVHIDWVNPADDWDLYVYRKGPGGELTTVASSAGGPPDTEENAVRASEGVPITPGNYVIRVVNYAASDPTGFKGTAKFGVFTPPNEIPIAKLSAPKRKKPGKRVKLDASASHDPDGTIKDYAFDLDGNGSMEVDNGNNPVLRRVLSPGVHHVAVRVTDDGGLYAFANRTVTVRKAKHKKKHH
jgi:hypothetical protein